MLYIVQHIQISRWLIIMSHSDRSELFSEFMSPILRDANQSMKLLHSERGKPSQCVLFQSRQGIRWGICPVPTKANQSLRYNVCLTPYSKWHKPGAEPYFLFQQSKTSSWGTCLVHTDRPFTESHVLFQTRQTSHWVTCPIPTETGQSLSLVSYSNRDRPVTESHVLFQQRQASHWVTCSIPTETGQSLSHMSYSSRDRLVPEPYFIFQ